MKKEELPSSPLPMALPLPHFPTRQQAFVWRNWEFVPVRRLAEVMETDVGEVEEMAADMGLPSPQPSVGEAVKHVVYNYLLQSNWHLLPYEQILKLLAWDKKRLNYALKEDDYMFIKLGALKPECEKLVYRKLTNDEKQRTAELAKLLKKHFPAVLDSEPALAFLDFGRERMAWSSSPAGFGEVALDGTWSIASELVFVADFIEDIKRDWNITFAGKGKNRIDLAVESNPTLPAESHTIQIRPDLIQITGVDENGLLRGLQWLLRQMEERGSAVLPQGEFQRITMIENRIIYPFHSNYADPFSGNPETVCPDSLLKHLSKSGVNGIWLQGVLYTLVPWALEPSLSESWQERIRNLRDIAHRAARYGIGVYLYMNEPRCLPMSFFEKHPALKGLNPPPEFGNVMTLCVSTEPVKNFLREGMAELFRQAPELAGLFTITASESPTNCHSKYTGEKCPRCSKRSPEEVIAEVNSLIEEGIHRVKPEAKVWAWSWGWRSDWQSMLGQARDWAPGIIERMPQKMGLIATSEEGMPLCIGGVESCLKDYSIAVPGPGERAFRLWELARRRGMPTGAKIQLNNSWELATVPYLPVLNRVDAHLQNLYSAGVRSLLLSWTMGGNPDTPNLLRLADYIWEGAGLRPLSEFAVGLYGKDAAPMVTVAWKLMSDAIRNFPHSIPVNYFSPLHLGPANLLFATDSGYRATMVGMPYDDLLRWRGAYSEETLIRQLKNLSEGWQCGSAMLAEIKSPADPRKKRKLKDLTIVAEACYCHFRSTYLQCSYISKRDQLFQLLSTNGILRDAETRLALLKDILALLENEILITKRLYVLASKDSRLGYESSHQYYYRPADLKEKFLNCRQLIDYFNKALEDCRKQLSS